MRFLFPLLMMAAMLGFSQDNTPNPMMRGMDMTAMKAEMAQMRTQMEEMQALMKDSMAKMAAADAAMKVHMETGQASMKSQMELQHAVITHLQTMSDHMQKMHDGMAMAPMHKD